jgi:hypothetical protein
VSRLSKILGFSTAIPEFTMASPRSSEGPGEEDAAEDQARRTESRAAALRFWLRAQGVRAEVVCHGKTAVAGTFCATDAAQEIFLLSELETPMGVYPDAYVRASDVICLDFAPSLASAAEES